MTSGLELLDVTKALGELSLSIAQTRELAFNLGVKLQELDNIDDERKGVVRTKYYMETWLSTDEEASWEKIIATLKSMRLNRQAAQLTEMISSPQFSPCQPPAQPATVDGVRSNPPVTSTSTGQPTLPQLLRLKIPEKVVVKVSDFGILLLDDTQGSALMAIEAKCRGDSVAAVREILQRWLQGQGTEVTWENLITTLKDLELNLLASEVETHVKNK